MSKSNNGKAPPPLFRREPQTPNHEAMWVELRAVLHNLRVGIKASPYPIEFYTLITRILGDMHNIDLAYGGMGDMNVQSLELPELRLQPTAKPDASDPQPVASDGREGTGMVSGELRSLPVTGEVQQSDGDDERPGELPVAMGRDT